MAALRSFCQKNSLLHKNKCGQYVHEYQAYEILKKQGLPMVPSFRANTPQDAQAIAQRLMSNVSQGKSFVDIVVKAQVHAGRGKGVLKENGFSGGVQTATSTADVLEYAQQMLGKALVTPQTGTEGKKCNDIFPMDLIQGKNGRPANFLDVGGY